MGDNMLEIVEGTPYLDGGTLGQIHTDLPCSDNTEALLLQDGQTIPLEGLEEWLII
jgi:hypothetical protein